jgi:2-polyprenyl-3-methyl-5-hydroxy-6-metoxy-1,4-benzoquinol methylase
MDYELKYLELNPTLHQEDCKRKVKEILSILPKDLQITTLLDYGCGGGFILKELVKYLDLEKAVGVDISTEVISLAKRHNDNNRIQFITCDELEFSPYQDFDCLLLIDLLEHLQCPIKILKKLRNRSNLIIVRVPLEDTFSNYIFALFGKNHFERTEKQYGHIHHFTLDNVLNLIEQSGYTLREFSIFPLPLIQSRFFYYLQLVCWFLIPRQLYAQIFGGFVVCLASN